MKASCFLVLAVAFANTAFALPSLFQEKQSSALSAVQKRGGAASIPGKDFTESDGTRAAAAAAPVWLFARQEINGHNPCYPEQATNADNDGPNPGTDAPHSSSPGEDCRDPGAANGLYSPGDSFPNYITTAFCPQKVEWRITYSIYFVHDGAMSYGHTNDWESATVVFREDGDGSNTWYRHSLLLSQHSGTAQRPWNQIQSVTMPNDVKRTDGQGLEHPKVYVGFFKHAMFFDKKTSLTVGGAPQDEYRSDDWYYMGKLGKGDFVPDQTLEAYKGDYGAATSDPATIETSTCGW